VTLRHVVQRLHPTLSDILNALDGTPLGEPFRDRAVELASSAAFAEPIDYRQALAAHLWLLERVDADGGLPLTAAGYLKPATVREFAEMLPTLDGWPFSMTREVDVHPMLHFREYLKQVGLLRKYKGTLRPTKVGRAGLADASVLWRHLADTLVPTASTFAEVTGVVVLVHMAAGEERIDVHAVARTMTELGWSHSTGEQVDAGDVYPVWNDLRSALGNVGPSAGSRRPLVRRPSPDAVALIRDALFVEVEGETA
jgi:hypothetical protein